MLSEIFYNSDALLHFNQLYQCKLSTEVTQHKHWNLPSKQASSIWHREALNKQPKNMDNALQVTSTSIHYLNSA